MTDLPIASPGQKTGYRVQLAVFKGPLDLLLHLIEREELDITRVSLARVTDQYLEYMTTLEELKVDDLSDFVVVAARLILIKSQSLLPRPPATVQQQDDRDAGEELLRQLRIYKRFKEAAVHLGERQKQGHRSFVRLAPRPYIGTGIEHLEPVPLDALLVAAQRILQTRTDTSEADKAVQPFTITMNDQIELVTRTLSKRTKVTFMDLLTGTYSRQEVAVTLLAVLELIKQQQVQARQERMFGEIVILPFKLPAGAR